MKRNPLPLSDFVLQIFREKFQEIIEQKKVCPYRMKSFIRNLESHISKTNHFSGIIELRYEACVVLATELLFWLGLTKSLNDIEQICRLSDDLPEINSTATAMYIRFIVENGGEEISHEPREEEIPFLDKPWIMANGDIIFPSHVEITDDDLNIFTLISKKSA